MCPNLFSWWVPDNNTKPIFFFSFLLAYLVDSDRWATTLVYNTQQQQQQMWQHIYKGGSPSYRRGGRIQHRRYRHGSQRVLHVCRMGHFGSARSQVYTMCTQTAQQLSSKYLLCIIWLFTFFLFPFLLLFFRLGSFVRFHLGRFYIFFFCHHRRM